MINSLLNHEILVYCKFKAFVDDKIIVTQKLKFGLGKRGKHCWKRRKCWLPEFSPLPAIFSQCFRSRGVNIWDCVVKSKLFSKECTLLLKTLRKRSS